MKSLFFPFAIGLAANTIQPQGQIGAAIGQAYECFIDACSDVSRHAECEARAVPGCQYVFKYNFVGSVDGDDLCSLKSEVADDTKNFRWYTRIPLSWFGHSFHTVGKHAGDFKINMFGPIPTTVRESGRLVGTTEAQAAANCGDTIPETTATGTAGYWSLTSPLISVGGSALAKAFVANLDPDTGSPKNDSLIYFTAPSGADHSNYIAATSPVVSMDFNVSVVYNFTAPAMDFTQTTEVQNPSGTCCTDMPTDDVSLASCVANGAEQCTAKGSLLLNGDYMVRSTCWNDTQVTFLIPGVPTDGTTNIESGNVALVLGSLPDVECGYSVSTVDTPVTSKLNGCGLENETITLHKESTLAMDSTLVSIDTPPSDAKTLVVNFDQRPSKCGGGVIALNMDNVLVSYDYVKSPPPTTTTTATPEPEVVVVPEDPFYDPRQDSATSLMTGFAAIIMTGGLLL
eukprot:Blabericola_migrator_1__2597@NODE_1733_length_3904_cov_412_686734_g1120_i0_p1_GENE_NODE_1733_length_3904_cov_412_686734_g1120_i0NODE_1733_length_3904_cov_412_686734_g1120_i0_p1_ORF_typecomplete_len457_score88_04_NODE_1733_length_3904_cov_412_686734_g1120_i09732343